MTKTEENKVETPKKKRGRPSKQELESKKPRNRGVRGRPPGDAARINELKARLLATSGDHVIKKIIDIALDDEHQGQMAALKMCMDRVLPISYFDKDKTSSGKSAVQITITGVGGETIVASEEKEVEGEVIDHYED